MMCMTKPLFGTGKSVVINSVFCVMKGLVGMLAHGVYRTTVINKNILAQVLHGRYKCDMLPRQGGWGCAGFLWLSLWEQVQDKVYKGGWICHEALQNSWIDV